MIPKSNFRAYSTLFIFQKPGFSKHRPFFHQKPGFSKHRPFQKPRPFSAETRVFKGTQKPGLLITHSSYASILKCLSITGESLMFG